MSKYRDSTFCGEVSWFSEWKNLTNADINVQFIQGFVHGFKFYVPYKNQSKCLVTYFIMDIYKAD